MKKESIVVYTQDCAYGYAFVDYLKGQGLTDWDIRIFSESELFSAYMESHPEIVVSDRIEEIYDETEKRCDYLIGLSERYSLEQEIEWFPSAIWIYKYQRTDYIVEEIAKYCNVGKGHDHRALIRRQVHVVTVFSLAGSLALRRMMRQEIQTCKGRCLYVGLEQFPEEGISEERLPGLSDYLYQIQECCYPNEATLRRYITEAGGYDSIRPIQDYRDLLDITSDNLDGMLRSLENCGYGQVVVGMDFLGEYTDSLLMAGDEIRVLIDENSSVFLPVLNKYLSCVEGFPIQEVRLGVVRKEACVWQKMTSCQNGDE